MQHVEAIQHQWKARVRDTAVITDRMERTFVARRLEVENVTVLNDLLKMYPALQDETQVGSVL